MVVDNIKKFPSITSSTPSWSKVNASSSQFRSQELSSKVPEIQELVQKLAEVENIARVRAVAPRAGDLHWIEFEMELQSEIELPNAVWSQVQDWVIDCEWKLRDTTNEKWYFHARIVMVFSHLQSGSQIVVSPIAESYTLSENHTPYVVYKSVA
jgi:hypothetical protein